VAGLLTEEAHARALCSIQDLHVRATKGGVVEAVRNELTGTWWTDGPKSHAVKETVLRKVR